VAASIKIAPANWLLGLSMVAWLVLVARKALSWRGAALYIPVASYALASLVSMAFSADPGRSFDELGEVVTLALVPLVVNLMDGRRWDRLLMAIAVVASLSSLTGLWQYLSAAATPGYRLHGFASHYMTFSGWTLVTVLMLVGDMVFDSDHRRLWWTAPAAAVSTAALVLSLTRGVWIGLAAALVLAAALRKPLVLLLYPVVAAGLMVALPSSVVQRAGTIFDLGHPSNYDRLCMVRSGLQMTLEHPLLGIGPGMVGEVYSRYRVPDAPREHVAHLHNNIVQLAAERGLLGLAAYLAIVGVFLGRTVAILKSRDREAWAPLMSCLLAVVGVTVAGLFEYNWGDAEIFIPTLTCLSAEWAA
jgi:O-antigen ligase